MKLTCLAMIILFLLAVVASPSRAAGTIRILGTGQSLSLQVMGIAEEVTCLTGQTAVHRKFGVGGTPYSGIMPGTRSYLDGITWGGVSIVDIIHGESDSGIGTTKEQYIGYLNQWQAAYADDLGFDVPVVTDQMSSNGNTWQPELVSQIALAQWEAARLNPSIYLVGPKYQYAYDDTGLHLIAPHNIWNGEQHGKVIAAVLSGEAWRPLEPDGAMVSGNKVVITFHVPVPPLQIDTVTVAERPFYGFEWEDVNGAAITAVTVGADRVILTLDQPTPGGVVRYAYTGTSQRASRWGNIKDSDATPSVSGNDLANWLVHFEIMTNYYLYFPVINND